MHDSHRLQPQSHHHVTYCGGSTCEIGLSVHDSHRLKTQSYLHATYPGGSICECGLSVYDSHRLKAQSYVHATYLSGSICKSGLSVHDSHRLKAQSYLHANYKYLCKWLVGPHSYRLQPQSHHRATYPSGSTRESGSICENHTVVEVSVKVACQSTTVTDCSHRAITMLLLLLEVFVKVVCRSTTATD